MSVAHLVHRHEVVDSTQRIAKELARAGAEHGTLVVAKKQSAGRGRKERTWLDVDEALLASIVLRPHAPLRFATRLPLAVCARIVGAIDLAAPDAHAAVKWPNDLLVPHAVDAPKLGPYRKVGGVLVEAVDVGEVLACCVVGVGINVRGAIPDDVRATAATLADVGYRGSADDLVPWIHAALLEGAGALDDASFRAVRELLQKRSATMGRRVDVDGIVGTAVAIDDDGALVIEGDDGVRRTARAGDADIAA